MEKSSTNQGVILGKPTRPTFHKHVSYCLALSNPNLLFWLFDGDRNSMPLDGGYISLLLVVQFSSFFFLEKKAATGVKNC